MDKGIKKVLDEFRFNVKIYREKKEWTQRDLAIQADYSIGAIGSLEAGSSKPSFDMIVKIAKTLKIHPALLFISPSELSEIAQKDEAVADKKFLHHIENELHEYLKKSRR